MEIAIMVSLSSRTEKGHSRPLISRPVELVQYLTIRKDCVLVVTLFLFVSKQKESLLHTVIKLRVEEGLGRPPILWMQPIRPCFDC